MVMSISLPVLAPSWQRPEVIQAIFDQLSDALFIYNRDLYITGVNHSAQRLFGMTSEEMVGRHCKDLFRCTVCEPGCAMAQGVGPTSCLPSGTIRLHTDNG